MQRSTHRAGFIAAGMLLAGILFLAGMAVAPAQQPKFKEEPTFRKRGTTIHTPGLPNAYAQREELIRIMYMIDGRLNAIEKALRN